MLSRPLVLIIALGISLTLIISCAGGSTGETTPLDAPITPSDTPRIPQDAREGHYLWGYAEIMINPSTMEFEIIPDRTVTGHWNVLTWLEDGPCTNCFKITSLTDSGHGTYLVDVEITHPFSWPNLTGFDVRGIAIFNGSRDFPLCDVTTPDEAAGDGELVNADGYTTLYNITTENSGPEGMQGYHRGRFASLTPPDATLNGYKRHITDDPGNTRNAFYAGDSVTVMYEIDMPDGPFIFGYAVDANWARPTVTPVTDPMTDFPISANCPEPWMIEVTQTSSGQGLTEVGGAVTLTINVYDWQGSDSHYLPMIECPELFSDMKTADFVADGDGFATYTAIVGNENCAGIGQYECLIRVIDTANDTAPAWLDLAAYQVIVLTVVEYIPDKLDPIAIATVDDRNKIVCETFYFSDDGSIDPDGGDIVKWEWDWDNDSVWDEEGESAEHTWTEIGVYPVQFRVTDDEGATDTLDTPISITVMDSPPVAEAEANHYEIWESQGVTFDGSASVDTDCGGDEIVLYEWDFENDGTWDDTGAIAVHNYLVHGIYEVQLRVTDDEGGTDVLDVPLEITVNEAHFPTALAGADPNPQTVCEEVFLYDDGSTSGGPPFAWAGWDFDNDGTWDEIETAPFDTTYTWNTPGTYYVNYQVANDDGFSDDLDEPLEIIIENALPTAIAWPDKYKYYGTGETVTIDATGSHDNDCSDMEIVQWEWDWDYDGTYDETTSEGIGTHVYSTSGVYYVQVRVTDDEGGTDILDSLIELYVFNGWAWSWGSDNNDDARCVATDLSGNTYVAGYFRNTVDFNPGNGTSIRESNGAADVYLCKYNNLGEYQWVKTWGGMYADYAWDIVVDSEWGVIVAGEFEDSVDFDPSGGTDIHESNGDSDCYVTKFDQNGNFQWAETWGGTGIDSALGVSAEWSTYIYIVGVFENTVDFDPNLGTDDHTSAGEFDAYLLRLFPDGGFSWAQTWGNSSYDGATDVSVDSLNKIFVTGYFMGTVDFKPGPDSENRVSHGGQDVFLVKYNNSGDFQWSRAWGGDYDDTGLGIAASPNYDYPDVYITGTFRDTVDFDPTGFVENHTSLGEKDCFIVKYTSSASYEWTRTWGGSDYDYSRSIGINNGGTYLAVAGDFRAGVDFDPGSGSAFRFSNGQDDAFLAVYTMDGLFNWVSTWGGGELDSCHGVTVDFWGDVYACGLYRTTIDFNPTSWYDLHTPVGQADAFVVKYPADGEW